MNFKKIKLTLGVLFVFLLILATNLIDQSNIKKVQDSIETIYEDRVVAQDIIYDLTAFMQEKEMANALADTSFYKNENQKINSTIQDLLAQYEATKLTEEEANVFSSLKNDVDGLIQAESGPNLWEKNDQLRLQLTEIKQHLIRLKEIQLEEADRQLSSAKKASDTIALFTRWEIYGLIILAILFQLIIILSPTKKEEY